MLSIEWHRESLTDSGLSRRLEALSDEVQCDKLYLNSNKLTAPVDLTKYRQFDNLSKIQLDNNKIREIDGNNFPPRVANIDLSKNNISKIKNFRQCTELKELLLTGNYICELDGSELPSQLNVLGLSSNKITTVKNLTWCNSLEELNLHGNDISNIDWKAVPHTITILHLSANKISKVGNLKHCSELIYLDLGRNQIGAIDWSGLPVGLQRLFLSQNNITDLSNCNQFRKLVELKLENNQIEKIDGGHLPPGLKHINLSANRISEVKNLSHLSMLDYLDLSSNQIRIIEWEIFPLNVFKLILSHNSISVIPNAGDRRRIYSLLLGSNEICEINGKNLPAGMETLDLSGNKIAKVRNLSDCTEMIGLNLQNNNIQAIDGKDLPPGTKTLNLSHNQISGLKNFNVLTALKELTLSNNNIRVLDISEIPLTVTHLNIDETHISELPALCHHSHLQWLAARGNSNLHTIHGLPDTKLTLNIYSGIKILGRKCFHRNTYMMLKKKCGQWRPEEPPAEVVNQGLDAVLRYYRERSARTTHTGLVLLGPTKAGKSSLLQSLLAGIPILVHIDNRTQVADIQTWDITTDDSIEVFDHGGHEIYGITSPLLITRNSLIALVHDITKVTDAEVDETTDILRHALQYHPGNQVHLVLTHVDLLNEGEIEKNGDYIKTKIDSCLDQEIMDLSSRSECDNECSRLSALLQEQKKMEVFLVSSKTCEGMSHLKHWLEQTVAQKRVTLPEKWVQLLKLMGAQKKNFLKVVNLKENFKELYAMDAEQREKDEEEMTKNFMSALQYFGDTGQVLYYAEVHVLNQYVFHNKEFVLDLLKSCFHHNLRDDINWHELQKVVPTRHIELMMNHYEQEGLLHIELLRHFWQSHGLSLKEEDAVLEIMKKVHICYPVDKCSKLLFFPWFVRNNAVPASVDPNRLSTISKHSFSVQMDCLFLRDIPVNAFEKIQVQILKTAFDKDYGSSQQAWKDGLLVQIGSLECIAIRKPADSVVSICIRGHASDIEEIWQVTSEVHLDLDSIMLRLLGVIKVIYFLCNHCLGKGLHPPEKWSPEKVLKHKGPEVSYVKCKKEDIPRALVIAPSENSKKTEKHLQEVQKYLTSSCRDVSVPGKLLYLDCQEVCANTFELTWCLPDCPQETDSSSRITHTSILRRVGQQWTPVTSPSNTSPTTLACLAEEFKVAAVNQNGTGEFKHVVPCQVIDADEVISDRDRDGMKVNHEFFSRMSSVWVVIMRLFSRRVISDKQKEKLVRMYHENGPHAAADHLMEMVHRLTYQKIFLFQKTLQETGQLVLAETLPVKLED